MQLPGPDLVGVDPDAAVRARLNAAVIDALLIGAITRGVLALLGVTTFSGNAVALIFGVQFLYYFAQELHDGQTLGKRAMRVRVVTLYGSPATMRQCAIRSGMRLIDALPLLYASGLISLMRTGRAKRQRLGDVVAGTTVIVGRAGRPLTTPRWLLPATTLVATVLSLAFVATSLHTHRRPADLSGLVATGFPGDNSQPPAPGTWQALGAVTFTKGYGDEFEGQRLLRAWRIDRTCHAHACSFVVTREISGGPPLTAALIPEPDGWHATFPDRGYPCDQVGGRTMTWRQRSTWVVRFSADGTTAEAHERNVSFDPGCGWGTDTLDWVARRTARSRIPRPSRNREARSPSRT